MESFFDKILKEQGLDFSELTDEERLTYQQGIKETADITYEHFVDTLEQLRYVTTLELCDLGDSENDRDKNSKLKGRLKVYVLLLNLLSEPERARRAYKARLKN